MFRQVKTFSKKDFALIGIVLLLAGGVFGWQHFAGEEEYVGVEPYAAIMFNGVVVKTVPLSYDIEFSIPERPNVRFAVRDGAAAFICSDCLDQICVHRGFIRADRIPAACLPNGLLLTIHGLPPEEFDILLG